MASKDLDRKKKTISIHLTTRDGTKLLFVLISEEDGMDSQFRNNPGATKGQSGVPKRSKKKEKKGGPLTCRHSSKTKSTNN